LAERRDDMADDKSNRGRQDASRINIHEDYEVACWTKKFGVRKAELEAAVKRVGVRDEAVAKELGKAHASSEHRPAMRASGSITFC
jgi:hypothetical protein